jgi:hypothetical protein
MEFQPRLLRKGSGHHFLAALGNFRCLFYTVSAIPCPSALRVHYEFEEFL